jgi:hypothetical protein
MKMLVLLVLALFAVPAWASQLSVLRPVYVAANDGDEISLGAVGPGQTVSVEADAIVTSGGKFGLGGRWDRLDIVQVPDGWSADNSLLYEQPLKARIKVAKDAPDGEYVVLARAVDLEGGENLGEVNLRLKVNVSRDVLGMKVAPARMETGATQPASYTVTVENNGVASDAFEISASGLPAWNFKKTVFVPYGQSRTVQYEVASSEEGEYDVSINVKSVSSDSLSGSQKVHLSVSTSLWSDYKATNNGLLLFPIFEQAAYSVMGLLANLF